MYFLFQPAWMRSKEYWDKSFEDRYERQKMDPERPPLKVRLHSPLYYYDDNTNFLPHLKAYRKNKSINQLPPRH